MLTDRRRHEAAELLRSAERDATPTVPPSEAHPGSDGLALEPAAARG
ncbi:hypothetical protein [Streptomyces sp. NPDC014656]